MNVLIIGSGGREHALAWKIAQSPLLTKLFISPGNSGTAHHGENVSLDTDDFEQVKRFVAENDVQMLVVGPEAPLVEGIHDAFLQDKELSHVMVIGPVKAAAMLEGSKDFAKSFMKKYDIPTAAYSTFSVPQLDDGLAFLRNMKAPYVRFL